MKFSQEIKGIRGSNCLAQIPQQLVTPTDKSSCIIENKELIAGSF
jgi:hypothetical protein